MEPEEKQQAQKEKNSNWKWIISCGAGVLILLGILIASLLGYLPGISAEYVMAAMILLVGTGAGATWVSEKKRKKQEASAQWREKVKKELDGASEEMEKFRIMAAELMNLDKQARANANNKHTITKKK